MLGKTGEIKRRGEKAVGRHSRAVILQYCSFHVSHSKVWICYDSALYVPCILSPLPAIHTGYRVYFLNTRFMFRSIALFTPALVSKRFPITSHPLPTHQNTNQRVYSNIKDRSNIYLHRSALQRRLNSLHSLPKLRLHPPRVLLHMRLHACEAAVPARPPLRGLDGETLLGAGNEEEEWRGGGDARGADDEASRAGEGAGLGYHGRDCCVVVVRRYGVGVCVCGVFGGGLA